MAKVLLYFEWPEVSVTQFSTKHLSFELCAFQQILLSLYIDDEVNKYHLHLSNDGNKIENRGTRLCDESNFDHILDEIV